MWNLTKCKILCGDTVQQYMSLDYMYINGIIINVFNYILLYDDCNYNYCVIIYRAEPATTFVKDIHYY